MAEKKAEHIVTESDDGSAVIEVPESELLTSSGEAPPPSPGEDDDDGDDDESLKSGGFQPTLTEEKRLQNREERKRKKEERKRMIVQARENAQKVRQLEEELARVKGAVAETQKTATSAQLASAQQALNDATLEERYHLQQRIEARQKNDAAAEIEAEEKMTQARERKKRIEQAIEQAKRPAPAQQPSGPDPVLLAHAKEWHARNAWFEPDSKSEVTQIVKGLDQAVLAAGFDPKTSDYYVELDKRIKKYLPNQGTGGKNGEVTNSLHNPPVTGSGRESVPTKTNQFRLSPDRVKAIKDAGAWDDAAKRMKMVRQYAEWDRKNQGAR
jgi:hypothetical protein